MTHEMETFGSDGVENGDDSVGTMRKLVCIGGAWLITVAMTQRIDQNDGVAVRQRLRETAVLPAG
ncbi:hypothetical protein D3C72_2038140 [compost metagenome]